MRTHHLRQNYIEARSLSFFPSFQPCGNRTGILVDAHSVHGILYVVASKNLPQSIKQSFSIVLYLDRPTVMQIIVIISKSCLLR